MKNRVYFLIMLIPVVAYAENYPGFDPQKMQNMMQKVQQMQVCMQNIDNNAMQMFEESGRQMEAEVKQLCTEGRRAEAFNKAMVFSKEVAGHPMMNKMKKCGEMMKDMIPMFSALMKGGEQQHSALHVCDVFN